MTANILLTFPGISHFYLGVTISACADIKNIIKNPESGNAWKHSNDFVGGAPLMKRRITFSIGRDLLALAVVITLAALSILPPTAAILIGVALLGSLILSGVAMTSVNSAKDAAKSYRDNFMKSAEEK